MARQQPNHRHDCPCNACVRLRNARRRRDADRYAEEGRPLPQRSQLYEVERDLSPVYDGQSAELQEIADAVRARTGRSAPPMIPSAWKPTTERPMPAPASQPVPQGSWGGIRRLFITLLFVAIVGGFFIYGAIRLDWLEFGRLETDDPPVVSLPVLSPIETPKPSELPPTETPNPTTPTPTIIVPTASPTPTPLPISTSAATPTITIAVAVPTEREIVVSAFAKCDGQYSGADRQARARAANHSIKEGYHTVSSIRALVDEQCGGVFPLLTVVNAERPTMAKPTPTARPIPTPTLHPTPTAAVGVSGRFNPAEMEAAIHQRINAYRQEQGRAKLKWDDRLARIARAHSEDMAKNDRYSHVGSTGDGPIARASKAGYWCGSVIGGVAENIHLLYGHSSTLFGRPHDLLTQEQMVQRFVADWTNSPGHRRNILGARLGKTGIGVAFGTAMGIEGGIYVTQKFC